jgi:hypothetical protein
VATEYATRAIYRKYIITKAKLKSFPVYPISVSIPPMCTGWSHPTDLGILLKKIFVFLLVMLSIRILRVALRVRVPAVICVELAAGATTISQKLEVSNDK